MVKTYSLGIGARILIAVIKLYQLLLSPLLGIGARCRFYPTCSNYGIESVMQFGCIKGIWLILLRLLRCHPFNKGGHDPVPTNYINK